jgi:DNA repair exonuclease SbcCD ATPase subunit
MAVKQVIEIDVDALNAMGGIDNLTKAIETTDGAVKSLKAQLRDAQNEVNTLSDKFGATSKEAVNAAKRAAELKDQIGDAKALTDAFNPDAKFNALSNSLSGVASGFSAYQGVLGLTGVESEQLEKQLLKVQSAMAIAQGLQGLGEARDSFKILKTVAIDAFKGIKVAIGSTGIGLLVVALGTIVAYWDDIKEAVSGVSNEQVKLNEQSKANVDLQKEKLDAVGGQENILKLQGKSERDILKIKVAQTDQVIKATEIQIQNTIATTKAQEVAAQRNKEILTGILKFFTVPIQHLLTVIDSVGSALGKNFGLVKGFNKLIDSGAELLFSPSDVRAKGAETLKEQQAALDKLKNDRAGIELSIQNIDKAATEKARSEAQKRADDAKAIRDKAHEQHLKDLEKEKEDLAKFNEILKQAESEEFQRKQEEEQRRADSLNEISKLSNETAIENNNAEIASAQALADHKVAMQEASFNLANSAIGFLKEIAGKNKTLQRAAIIAENAVGIAKIITSTQAANAAAVAKYALVPGGQALSATEITLNKISAGIGIATTLASTAKALSAIGGGGGGASSGGSVGGGATGGSAPAPQFNVIGNSGVNQIASTLGSQQPVQAYVVANNVTTAQSLDRNIINNASL